MLMQIGHNVMYVIIRLLKDVSDFGANYDFAMGGSQNIPAFRINNSYYLDLFLYNKLIR